MGPSGNAIPLFIGGNGPKAQRFAAHYADIYGCFAEQRSHVEELGPRLTSLEKVCEEIGHDPATIGRSAGVEVLPLEPAGSRPDSICGPTEAIADALRSFGQAGFTSVEIMFSPGMMDAFEALARVAEVLARD